MDRVDRMLRRVKPKPSIHDKLLQNNPFWGKSFGELLDYMSPNAPEGARVPENGTREKDKFSYALLDAFCRRRKEQRGDKSGKD